MGNTLDKKGGVDPKYLLPQGSFSKTAWDPKLLKKSVIERRLAPFFPGAEDKGDAEAEECPICFLYYPGGLNRAKCCKKGVCSECYIQIKKGQNSVTSCPFCNNRRYMTVYTGPLSKEERDSEEREEKKVQDLKAKMQLEEAQRKDSAPSSPQLSSSNSSVASSPASPLTASSPYSSERKDSGSVPLPPAPAPAPAAPVPAPAPAPAFDIFVPPPGANVEEAMLAEAIRRSLLDSSGAPEASSASEPPQSSASDRDPLPAVPQAAVAPAPSVRRIALEDPSEESGSESESSSGSSSASASASASASSHSGRRRPRRPKQRADDDAQLREAIRLSLLEDAAPAASRP